MLKTVALFCVVAVASAKHTDLLRPSQAGYARDATTSDSCIATLGDGTELTCSLPQHTTYAQAFQLAASLEDCESKNFMFSNTRSSYSVESVAFHMNACYFQSLCRFCFKHSAEYWLLEAALGTTKSIKDCANEQGTDNTLNCPTRATLDSVNAATGKYSIADAAHGAWGDRAYAAPGSVGASKEAWRSTLNGQ